MTKPNKLKNNNNNTQNMQTKQQKKKHEQNAKSKHEKNTKKTPNNSNCSHILCGSENLIEGSLEVKLPTIWTDEKQSRAEAERGEILEEKRVEEKESKKEDADARKGIGKSRNTVFFQ